jgi:hypothetical protein
MESGFLEPNTQKTEHLSKLKRVWIFMRCPTLLSRMFMNMEGRTVRCWSDSLDMMVFFDENLDIELEVTLISNMYFLTIPA